METKKKVLSQKESKTSLKERKDNQHLIFTPGIWMEGKMKWFSNGIEKIFAEEEISIHSKRVPVHSKVEFHSISVRNHGKQSKSLKIVSMHHYSNMAKNHFTFVAPAEGVIFHLTQKKVFLVNGRCEEKGMKQCTTQPMWNIYTDDIWGDLQKGNLKYQPMAKGGAASLCFFEMTIPPGKSKKIATWIIEGNTKNELIQLDHALLKNRLAFPFEK